MSEAETSADEENVFYFEGDHLALRGNRDYCNMLRAIVMLQAQKLRVHKQIDELEEAKRKFLADPDLLITKIQNNEPIISPNYMSIVKIPELSKNYDLPELPENAKVKTESSPESTVVNNSPNVANSDQQVVRGRIIDGIKSETFNRLWTNEEQRRLEQLLIEYPPEEVEARRFAKIAKALGNRTPQQVSSRVQKYFVKLHEAGMPVPGRLPKYRRTPVTKPKYYKQSTFFPAHNLTMQMPEEDDFMLDSLQSVASPAQMPDDDFAQSVKSEMKQDDDSEQASCDDDVLSTTNSTKQLLLKLLKGIRDEKIKTADGYNPDPLAAKCAECETATVARTRWRCNSCYCFLNLCLDCLTGQLIDKTFEHITHDVEEVA